METPATMGTLIPRPVIAQPDGGTFTLPKTAKIVVDTGAARVAGIGQYLASKLRPATGYLLPVTSDEQSAGRGKIKLTTRGADPALGEEGYELTITAEGVRLAAHKPAGLFRGVQTLRQLLPPAIESDRVQPVRWTLPTGTIRDWPRFAWRGVMLDVARHFFPPEVLKRYIDHLAYYKINTLHLHLSDDQGWRIMIESWPNLAKVGGSTRVGGGPGGYYTQAEYADLVKYCQRRHITLVPEIDMPGHTNAALASYPELNPDGKAPELYTGIEVGFSSLSIEKEITYRFVDDVIRELAALTPGPYLHIGGDEAEATRPEDYVRFIEKVQEIVRLHGKRVVGWEEIGQARLEPGSIAQRWNFGTERGNYASLAARQGAKVIMSPANRAYMDMKYDDSTELGLVWAGTISVAHAYCWDPVSEAEGLQEGDILGVEAALWAETLETLEDIEFMTFPRLPGYAELGWSPSGSEWEEYRLRLAVHGPRWQAAGIRFFPSPEVPW